MLGRNLMGNNLFVQQLDIPFVGPHKHEPLPAIFYFALSGLDSLFLDPFNQPVLTWQKFPLRVFSITLPGHDERFAGDIAMKKWREAFAQGHDLLTPFFSQVASVIQELIQTDWIDPHKIAVSGLSRGGFVAAHIAAKVPEISHVLGFAPLTTLQTVEEFSSIKKELASLDLMHLKTNLHHQKHRYYIGNRDTRVSTKSCFEYVSSLSNEMYYQQIRHLPVELFIKPSIGRHGHGTSASTFEEGALWLANSLLEIQK